MKVIKADDKIIVRKNNGKYSNKSLFLQFLMISAMSLFAIAFFNSKIAMYFFVIGNGVNFLGSIPYRLSYLANEEMIIKKNKILITYSFFKIPLKKIKINNDNFLDISYNTFFKTNLKMYIKSVISIITPNRYRLMKLTYENKTYSFGYDLSENDYNTIKNLILEQRETR